MRDLDVRPRSSDRLTVLDLSAWYRDGRATAGRRLRVPDPCSKFYTIGWVERFEPNFFGAVLGFDLRRPALKLPGLGRFGFAVGLWEFKLFAV